MKHTSLFAGPPIVAVAVASVVFANTAAANAQTRFPSALVTHATAGVVSDNRDRDRDDRDYEAIVPVTVGWYNGQISLYLSTDSSRRDVSRATHTNYVPKLRNAIAGGAVDDIYQFTNFKQGNILPSSPAPAGSENTDPSYTPLWQLSLVTWVSGQPHTLKSEADVLVEKGAGHVTVVKTDVVINCPVIFTPRGGVLYGVHIRR